MTRQFDGRGGLTAVPDPTPSLGDSLAALAETDYDTFDRLMRPHLEPERVKRDLELARRLVFGSEAA